MDSPELERQFFTTETRRHGEEQRAVFSFGILWQRFPIKPCFSLPGQNLGILANFLIRVNPW